MAGFMNAGDILHNTSRSIYMKHMSTSLSDRQGESMTYRILAAQMIVSSSKSIAEATLSGFPAIQDVDGRGEFTSRGQVDKKSIGIVLKKQGAVLDIKDLEFKSITNVGNFGKIMVGVTSQALQGIVRSASHVVNNLDTGIYTTFNNETPAQLIRPNNSIYVHNGKNLARNMGSAEFSGASVQHAMTAVDGHQSEDLTTIPNKVIGVIVDRSNYRNAKRIIRNEQIGSDYAGSGTLPGGGYSELGLLEVGLADFEDPRSWLLITSAARIGWAVFRGNIFPTIFSTKNPETENAGIVTKWYHKPFCLVPYGFYLNKFTS